MYNPQYGKPSYGSVKKIKNYSYNPLDSIGKGFSSVVYKGQNDDNSNFIYNMATQQIIAVKAIDMRGIRDSAAKQMLQYEIEALTTLNHQNIMKCYDVIKDSSYCYIITELCNGGDLGEMLKKKGKFTQIQTLKILQDIVKGYIQIGNKGFLHRDLKLANVLINNGQAKIADFGFAKKSRTQSMKQRYNVGSPLYMSPQALKSNIYSMKNDIWSIGIMTYEMLHGDTPWQCKTEKQLIDKMTKIPVKFKDSLKISNQTKDFIRKCLQINESKRMSLQGLKQWIKTQGDSENINKQNQQNVFSYQAPKLISKPSAFDKLQSRPLSELTNKMGNHNKNSKSMNKMKVEHCEVDTKQKLSKSVIAFNNNLIVKLYFKALQKLKSASDLPSPSNLKNILGNQTIRRVTLLKKLICSQEISANQHYSLKSVEQYLNPINNPDIKKYKSVVNEYFNKYTGEIKMQVLSGRSTPSQTITSYLKSITQATNQQVLQKQSLLIHWLINLTKVSSSWSKNQLQSILQPKSQLSPRYIKERMQEICI